MKNISKYYKYLTVLVILVFFILMFLGKQKPEEVESEIEITEVEITPTFITQPSAKDDPVYMQNDTNHDGSVTIDEVETLSDLRIAAADFKDTDGWTKEDFSSYTKGDYLDNGVVFRSDGNEATEIVAKGHVHGDGNTMVLQEHLRSYGVMSMFECTYIVHNMVFDSADVVDDSSTLTIYYYNGTADVYHFSMECTQENSLYYNKEIRITEPCNIVVEGYMDVILEVRPDL